MMLECGGDVMMYTFDGWRDQCAAQWSGEEEFLCGGLVDAKSAVVVC